MPDLDPVEVTNLDRYGSAELPWSRPRDLLASEPPGPETSFFLGTSRPDGRPHAAGIGALWDDGELYFTSGPGTRKARNLAANPACTISVKLEGIDLVMEGEAARITDGPTLERVAGRYRENGVPVSPRRTRQRSRRGSNRRRRADRSRGRRPLRQGAAHRPPGPACRRG